MSNQSNPPPINDLIPKVEARKFDGTEKEWDSWKELFTMVDIDFKIPDLIKLRLLLATVNKLYNHLKHFINSLSITQASATDLGSVFCSIVLKSL